MIFRLTSIEGEGSRFDFSVIVEKARISQISYPKITESMNLEMKICRLLRCDFKLTFSKEKNYKILLAEDNLINQKVAIRTLNSAGYQVDAVMNGEQAIRAYTQHNYNLILMDVQMPEMDGFTATKNDSGNESTEK